MCVKVCVYFFLLLPLNEHTHTHTQPFAHCMCEQQSWLILTHSLVSLMLDAFECVHFNWNEFSWHPLAHPIIYTRIWIHVFYIFALSTQSVMWKHSVVGTHKYFVAMKKSNDRKVVFSYHFLCGTLFSRSHSLSSSARNNMQCIYLCVYSVSIHTERARARDHGHKTLYMRNKALYVLN